MESRKPMASLAIAADSSTGRMGLVVNRSHGVKGAVARARVAALSASTIATPPDPSAKPQKPLNSKPSGGFHCEKKARFRRIASSLVSVNSHVVWNSTAHLL